MEANELRLGNYLTNFLGEVFEANGMTIANFYHNEFGNPEPIKLTKEWILKFGFEKDNHNNYVISLNEFINLELMKLGDEWLNFSVRKSNTDECFSFMRIRYVHQLQNLYFALTNRELTIKENANCDECGGETFLKDNVLTCAKCGYSRIK